MTPPITIVERTTTVNLDELERLMREFLADKGGTAALADWHLSTFLEWLRQRLEKEQDAEAFAERAWGGNS